MTHEKTTSPGTRLGRLIGAALLAAACGGGSGSAPATIGGTWLFHVVESSCPDVIPGMLDENGGTAAQVFVVGQAGSQVSAQFVDGGGGLCSISGTYTGGQLRGRLTVEAPGRTIVASVEGFGRIRSGRRQVDGWLRVEQDSAGRCDGGVIEFCADLDAEPDAPAGNVGPTVALLEPAADACVVAGVPFPVTYRDDDPDDVARTTILADRDGDPATTADQVVIAADLPDGNGATRTVTWDTAGVTAAPYTILAVTTDGSLSASDSAGGRVTVACQVPADLAFVATVDAPDGLNMSSVATFEDGSFVVTGGFEGSATFGSGEAGATTLVSEGFEDIFLARYHADGRLAWARRAGGPDQGFDGEGDYSDDVATFPDGSCVITGRFQGTANFGRGEANETFLSTGGGGEDDVFVARYAADGSLQWVAHATSGGTEEGWTVTTFADGTCVAAGRYFGTLTFAPGLPEETTLPFADHFDVWFARYAADGTLQWVRRAGARDRDRPLDSASYPDGSFVLTGMFEGSTRFGEGEPNETSFDAVDGRELWIARFHADGALDWAYAGVGPGRTEGRSVALLIDGSVILAVRADGDVTFDEGGPNETTIPDTGNGQVKFVRFAADGTLLYAKSDGGPGNEGMGTVASFADGSFLGVGSTSGTGVLGVGTPNETSFVSDAEGDLLYAHYGADGNLRWACREGGPGDDSARRVATFPDGSFVVLGRSDGGTKTFAKGTADETQTDARHLIVGYARVPIVR